MSEKQTRDYLLAGLEAVATVPIAYENAKFDPANNPAYYQFSYHPVEALSLGKGANASDDQIGFASVNVFVRQNADNYDNYQLELLDTLKGEFYPSAVYGSVSVTDATVSSGRFDGGWFIRTLTINYSTYTVRS